ncbi:MAG: response regulator transcription factor [Bacilli bacterium]
MYKICLVEDEKNLNELITMYLKKEGYEVVSCLSGKDAINVQDKIDLWILDIMLGDDINGYDIIKKIREKTSVVPVIFTSARDRELDKIIGFELDADDYMTKPYSPKELMLRVNKLIKRVYNNDFTKLEYESYVIDTKMRVVLEKNNEIPLTTLEFDLLMLLITNKNITFSREDIIAKVWNEEYYGSDRVVDDLVRRLRHKMPKLNINTIYGFGYRLV